jgi:hypothetical protein
VQTPLPGTCHPQSGGDKRRTKVVSAKVVTSIIDGLKQIYFNKVGGWVGVGACVGVCV